LWLLLRSRKTDLLLVVGEPRDYHAGETGSREGSWMRRRLNTFQLFDHTTRMRPRTLLRVASAIGERLLGKFTRSHPSRSCSDPRDSRACPPCVHHTTRLRPSASSVAADAAFGVVGSMTKPEPVPSHLRTELLAPSYWRRPGNTKLRNYYVRFPASVGFTLAPIA